MSKKRWVVALSAVLLFALIAPCGGAAQAGRACDSGRAGDSTVEGCMAGCSDLFAKHITAVCSRCFTWPKLYT